MEPIVSVAPELDPGRKEAVPAPERRKRHLLSVEPFFHLGNRRVELGASGERRRLRGRPRGDLAASRAGAPVGARLLVGRFLDGSFDANLTPELPPVQHGGGERIGAELASLARRPVGEEDDAVRVDALQQHDACRRPAVGVSGGERHRLRPRVGGPRIVQPRCELGDGVVVEVSLVHASTGCSIDQSDG